MCLNSKCILSSGERKHHKILDKRHRYFQVASSYQECLVGDLADGIRPGLRCLCLTDPALLCGGLESKIQHPLHPLIDANMRRDRASQEGRNKPPSFRCSAPKLTLQLCHLFFKRKVVIVYGLSVLCREICTHANGVN